MTKGAGRIWGRFAPARLRGALAKSGAKLSGGLAESLDARQTEETQTARQERTGREAEEKTPRENGAKRGGLLSGSAFAARRATPAMLEALEEQLILADLGPAVAARLVGTVARARLPSDTPEHALRLLLAREIAAILAPVMPPERAPDGGNGPAAPDKAAPVPHVVLLVGVNGGGKTTTAAKLAARYLAEGKRVLLVACDSFRAAASEQLEIWAARVGCPVRPAREGADPAALAYDGLAAARKDGYDVVILDTAGRLHSRTTLMDELAKIARSLGKQMPGAPHETLLVLDATSGQNALRQAELFAAAAPLSGLVLTKLDGTARGGIAVALAEAMRIPILALGVGERTEDLRGFSARDFAAALLELDGLEEAG